MKGGEYMLINNQSECVIVVSNMFFAMEIPALQSIKISEDDINNDPQLEFSFFLKRKNKQKMNFTPSVLLETVTESGFVVSQLFQ